MARGYAQVVGVLLLLLGVLGLIMGEQRLAGMLNIDAMEDIVHLITGAVLVYAGFAHRDYGFVRQVVGVLGVLFLLIGLMGFVAPDLFGLLPHGYSMVDNLTHLLLGAVGVIAAWFAGQPATARARGS